MLTASFTGLYSGKGPMPRASCVAWAITAVVLACAGCSPPNDPPSSSPSPSSPSTSPVESSPSATPAIPPYLTKYTTTQRKAYAEAVDAHEAFGLQQAKIFADGKATPKAKKFYKTNSGDWLTSWARLRQREADGIRVLGRGETLRIRPAAVQLGNGGGTIDLRVCGIAEGVKVLQEGQPIPQPQAKARIVNVRLIKLENDPPWRVFWERPGGSC